MLSTEQNEHKNIEESVSNIKYIKHCGIQSENKGAEMVVLHEKKWPIEDESLQLAEETTSVIDSSANSISHSVEMHKTRCVICSDTEQSPDYTTISCDHSFHSLCIKTWFQIKKSCPICNPEISANDNSIGNDCDDTSQFPNFESMSCGHNVHAVCAETSFAMEVCSVCIANSVPNNSSLLFEDNYVCDFPVEMKCVICLDTVESSDFEYISCCHCFHLQCIQTWFREKEICPVCMVSNSSNATEDEALYGFFENVRCTICMDIEESSDFQYLSCGHSFHTMCTETWFLENNSCPTCTNVHVSSTSNTQQKEDKEDVLCVICVDTEDSPELRFLPCCHRFHSVCIESWLKKGNSCPICKTPILNEDTLDATDNGTVEISMSDTSDNALSDTFNDNLMDTLDNDSLDITNNDTSDNDTSDTTDNDRSDASDNDPNDSLDVLDNDTSQASDNDPSYISDDDTIDLSNNETTDTEPNDSLDVLDNDTSHASDNDPSYIPDEDTIDLSNNETTDTEDNDTI